MNKDYRKLAQDIRSNLNPEGFLSAEFDRELSKISYSDVLVFIRSAMKGVEPEYTKKSKEAGEKVKGHLETFLTNVKYEYQGSVMTNTHIKGYSDIDLIVLANEFYFFDRIKVKNILGDYNQRQQYEEISIRKLEYENSRDNYKGDWLAILKQIRLKSEQKMLETYTVCDISKPKSIKITNRNLKRDVDIVTANWYDDVMSILNDKKMEYRGVQVYDKHKHERDPADFPFLSIYRINERSSRTNGRLKKMIRFLKHCKAESGYQIELSSFDINAICYAIDIEEYIHMPFYDLVPVLYNQLNEIYKNSYYADNITSVDEREYIFKNNSNKRECLSNLIVVIGEIYFDLKRDAS